MKIRPAVLVCGAVLVSLLAFDLRAQEPTAVRGQVTSRDSGAPIAGATVAIPSLKLSTVTDQDGRYVLPIPESIPARQTVEITVTAPGSSPQTFSIALTGGAITRDFALGFTVFETVTVGSRAAGAAAEKAVPVDVFTEEQIESATSTTETSQILQALTPSFNFPRPTITDGTDSVRPATLRNLGPDQLLVLINGKRRHTSALVNVNNSVGRGSTGVDLNAIPAAAIARISCRYSRPPATLRGPARPTSNSRVRSALRV